LKRILQILVIAALAGVPLLLSRCTIGTDPWPGTLTVTAHSDLDEGEFAARIILDGDTTQYYTTHTFVDLTTGTHTVELVLPQYSMGTGAQSVTLTEDNPHAELDILMLRNRGTLNLTAVDTLGNQIAARVIMDVTSQGIITPVTLTPPTGTHLLQVAADLYTAAPESILVDVIHNGELDLEFILTAIEGEAYPVEINAQEEDGSPATGLEVWLDALPAGLVTPALVQVAPNSVDHLLELRVGYNTRAEVLIPAGQEGTYIWEPVVSDIELTVISTPDNLAIYIDELPTWTNTPHAFPLLGEHFISVAGPGYVTDLPGGYQLDISGNMEIEFTLTQGVDGVVEGCVATDFSLPLYGEEGVEMSLHQFRGRVTLLNFWFVDCPNCIAELPGLNQVYNEFSGEGFRFVTVDEWGDFDIANLDQFFADYPEYDFPVMLDQNYEVTTLYGFDSAPWNLLIDKTGVIRHLEQTLEEDQLRTWVEELINE